MKRNDIWLVNLDPTIGAEIRKTRPCVIVSNDAVGVLPLKVIAPLTDFKERYQLFRGWLSLNRMRITIWQNHRLWICFRYDVSPKNA